MQFHFKNYLHDELKFTVDSAISCRSCKAVEEC